MERRLGNRDFAVTRDVKIIVMDNDDAGQKGARKRQKLFRRNSSVDQAKSRGQADRSPGHDVIDENQIKGYPREALRELLKALLSPHERIICTELDTVETKPVAWLWNPIFTHARQSHS